MQFNNYLLLNTALGFSQNLLMDNSHLLCKCGSSSDFLLCFCAHLSLNGGRNRHFGSPFWGPFNRFIFEESKACKVQSPFKIQSQLHSYEIRISIFCRIMLIRMVLKKERKLSVEERYCKRRQEITASSFSEGNSSWSFELDVQDSLQSKVYKNKY